MEWLSKSFSLKEEEISPIRQRHPTQPKASLHQSLSSLREQSSGDEPMQSFALSPVEQVKEWREADLAETHRSDERNGDPSVAMLEVQNEELRSKLLQTREELERVKWEKERMSRAHDENDGSTKDEISRIKEDLDLMIEENHRKELTIEDLKSKIEHVSVEVENVRAEKIRGEEELAAMRLNFEEIMEDMRKLGEDNRTLEGELHVLLAARPNDKSADEKEADDFESSGEERRQERGFEEKSSNAKSGLQSGNEPGDDVAGTEFSIERISLIQQYAAKSVSRLYALVKQLRKEEARGDYASSGKIDDFKRVLSLTEKAVIVQEELEISLQLIETRLTRRFEELRRDVNGPLTEGGANETSGENASLIGQMRAIEEKATTALEETKGSITKELKVLKKNIHDLTKEVRRGQQHHVAADDAHKAINITDLKRLLQEVSSVVTDYDDKDEAIGKIASLFLECGRKKAVSTRSLLGSIVKYEDKNDDKFSKEKSQRKLVTSRSSRRSPKKSDSKDTG